MEGGVCIWSLQLGLLTVYVDLQDLGFDWGCWVAQAPPANAVQSKH